MITIAVLNQRETSRELAASDAAGALNTNASTSPYTDFDGNPANLEQYLGQVLVVNSWASWSPSSATELNLLADAVSPFTDEGVVLIAINRAESKSLAESYLETIGVDQRVQLIVDTTDRYYREIGGYTMPETVFYDQKGNIVAHVRGALTRGEVEQYIEEALTQD
jgi:thiol-disulfide isomerase/thioredoxin